jgi:hypothetical protein
LAPSKGYSVATLERVTVLLFILFRCVLYEGEEPWVYLFIGWLVD